MRQPILIVRGDENTMDKVTHADGNCVIIYRLVATIRHKCGCMFDL